MEKTSVKELRGQFADYCNDLLTYNRALNQEISIDGTVSTDPKMGNKYIYFSIADNDKSPINIIADSGSLDALFLNVGHRVNVKGKLSLYKQGYLKGFDLMQIHATSIEKLNNMTADYSSALLYVKTFKKAEKTLDYSSKPYMTVAVITSREGEGMPDVKWAMNGCDYFKLKHVPTNMYKPEEISRNVLNAQEDIVMVVRGGTTNIDVFNDVRILMAVGKCKKFTICGIGHAQQDPLINKVVDMEQSTPTAAGMFLKNSYGAYRGRPAMINQFQEQAVSNINKKSKNIGRDIMILILGAALTLCLLKYKFNLF